MPDAATLAEMYGTDYSARFAENLNREGSPDGESVLRWLRRLGRGRFLDYGCGTGILLSSAHRAGWQVIGVEYHAEVAQQTARETGLPVVTLEEARGYAPVDVIHVGDVIEHLTNPRDQLRDILRLLRPGGVLLAQGPLEANASLFTLAVRTVRRIRPGRTADMPPYHVTLATLHGQARFFERLGIKNLELSVSEEAWPAPARLSSGVVARPRLLALYMLRTLSRITSRLRPRAWGNRYFYAGLWEKVH